MTTWIWMESWRLGKRCRCRPQAAVAALWPGAACGARPVPGHHFQYPSSQSTKGFFGNLPFWSSKSMQVKSRDEGRALPCRGFHPSGGGDTGEQQSPKSLQDWWLHFPSKLAGTGILGVPCSAGVAEQAAPLLQVGRGRGGGEEEGHEHTGHLSTHHRRTRAGQFSSLAFSFPSNKKGVPACDPVTVACRRLPAPPALALFLALS